jgi:hypothetical protein
MDGGMIKCLSVCQPYPLAIFWRIKRVENRPWATTHRGQLLIHASRSRRWMDGLTDPQAHELVEAARERGVTNMDAELQFGEIVGVVDLYTCVDVAGAAELDPNGTVWHAGPFCFMLRNARKFVRGIPYRGSLSLFNVPRSLVAPSLETAVAA